ncbi:MAG: hypothetical protein Q8P20_04940 [bacterium]|nr:hypothetical protein [bacterium]
MSNLSKFVSFLALLEKIPLTEHLGNKIREDTSLKPFIIPPNKLLLFIGICINNRDGPIIGLVNYLELNIEDQILIVSIEDGEEYKIPLQDLEGMKFFSTEEALMLTKALLNEEIKKTKKNEGIPKCPHQIAKPKSARI